MMNIDSVIEGCRKGNRAMQKVLYDTYSPRFFAVCRRYAADDEEARDILVDGFIAVYECIEKYKGEGSFEGWMHSIFQRTAIAYYRKNLRIQKTFSSMDNVEYPDTGNVIHQIDIRDALIEALRQLPDEERIIFNLVAVEEYSFVDAGEATGIAVSTAKSRYYRALQKVQNILKSRLGDHYLK